MNINISGEILLTCSGGQPAPGPPIAHRTRDAAGEGAAALPLLAAVPGAPLPRPRARTELGDLGLGLGAGLGRGQQRAPVGKSEGRQTRQFYLDLIRFLYAVSVPGIRSVRC